MLDAEAKPALDTSNDGGQAQSARPSGSREGPSRARAHRSHAAFRRRKSIRAAHALKWPRASMRSMRLRKGLPALSAKVPADPESQSLFRRNWGPGVRSRPRRRRIPIARRSSAHRSPSSMFGRRHSARHRRRIAGFCALVEKQPKVFEDPFTAIRESQRQASAVPYSEASVSRIGVDRGGRAERRRRRFEWRQRRTSHRVPARRRQRLHHQ